MIVGTAGHVDHGKTSLVRALTGIDTDRLKEEKARGISIDLGFAYMPGRDGDVVGFVDVPGHERFVRTMVAGAAAIDFALLVVAADDGLMPQTREHLDVLDLLGLRDGIAVVTKIDRVDEARRRAVAADLAAALAGTSLAGTDITFVSSASGDGVAALRATLVEAAARRAARADDGVFRLSVDRSFTLTGVGTIATGTAISGRVATDDEVTVVPGLVRARIRSIHAQNRQAPAGGAGERCALALAGLGKDAIPRGAWICGERTPHTTARADAALRLLRNERKPLASWTAVTLHCGASVVSARVVPLSADLLQPGETGYAQIILDEALPLRHGDRLVLRDASAQRTIGGGMVLDPRAPLRRRRSAERLAHLAALDTPQPTEALRRLLQIGNGFVDLGEFAADRGMTLQQGETLPSAQGMVRLAVGTAAFAIAEERWAALAADIEGRLARFHADNPDLPGLAGERLRLLLQPPLAKPLFNAVRERLVALKHIALQGHWIRLPGHVAQLSAQDQAIAKAATPLIAADRFRPPRVRDIAQALSVAEANVRAACKALVRTGVCIEVAHDHFFLRTTVAEMAGIAEDLSSGSATGFFAAAAFRDRLDNGRKVSIQILEFFDRQGLTRRDGDLRRVVKAPELVFGTT